MPDFTYNYNGKPYTIKGAATEEEAYAEMEAYVAEELNKGGQPAMPPPGDMAAAKERETVRNNLLKQSGDPTMDIFKDAYTLGLQKPLAGAANALFGGSYEAGAGAYKDVMDQKRAEAGTGGTVADVAGSVLSGRPGANTSVGKFALGQGALGATAGAAHNAEDPEKAAQGAGLGGLLGLGLGRVFGPRTPKPTKGIDVNKAPGTDIPKQAFPLMTKRLEGGGHGGARGLAAKGLDLGADALSNRYARLAGIGTAIMHGNIPAIAGSVALGGVAPPVLRAGARKIRQGPSKQLAEYMTPEIQAVLNGPPSRQKLALMQSLGLTRSEESNNVLR